jgi:hypothetical protein
MHLNRRRLGMDLSIVFPMCGGREKGANHPSLAEAVEKRAGVVREKHPFQSFIDFQKKGRG